MNECDTLYFDGSCPLCRREMAHLARLKSDELTLQDIHDLPDDAALPDKAAMLQSLHLRRDGDWVTGLDANVAAWQYTRIGFFWRWLSWPIIKPVAAWAYTVWATRRYAKRYPSPNTPDASPK